MAGSTDYGEKTLKKNRISWVDGAKKAPPGRLLRIGPGSDRDRDRTGIGIGLLADRDWVDHRLYRALVLVLPQDEHEFVRFVLGQFKGVDIFENVGATHRQ